MQDLFDGGGGRRQSIDHALQMLWLNALRAP